MAKKKQIETDMPNDQMHFKLTIDCKGEGEDGIKSTTHAGVHCNSDFAHAVIKNFFEKDEMMLEIFTEVILSLKMQGLFNGLKRDDNQITGMGGEA